MRTAPAGLIILVVLSAAFPVAAQNTANGSEVYPARYVRLVTGAAGSMPDIVGRQLGQRLSERWGQSVVIDNRGGAGGSIATALAAKAAPDGYTILLSDRTAITVAPHLHKNLAYDPQKDLVPISLVALAPQLMVAHPSLPASNLREFLGYVKQLPGPIDFAAAGVGTASHLSAELFKQAAGISLLPVHYKGGGAAVLALLSGEIKVGFSVIPVSLPHVRAAKLKAYGITSRSRFAGIPDIPTVAEAGLPDFEAHYWVGMFVPAKTPAALVARINRDLVEILQASAGRAMLADQGAEPRPGSPEDFAIFIRNETAKMKKLVEVAGIRAE